jgi:hypothetical protein
MSEEGLPDAEQFRLELTFSAVFGDDQANA